MPLHFHIMHIIPLVSIYDGSKLTNYSRITTEIENISKRVQLLSLKVSLKIIYYVSILTLHNQNQTVGQDFQ